ncbi:hypothetical protein OU787_01090 [Kitasatospora sp. YST-16]|uniref:hypothetical protein n=1 Tax=Kitasatospora sp. YST-16 TaxID=2998080 RepID=UPI002283F40C|nr:hypothetical protein [Kitasatospora sp. YST-16]WAL70206.1 hypothetical protein OU787_01090 [Kitasatospora sp. YST-16]WNW36247.1 hypothetical protein RKE32_01100 [Streptomyces sp. Li-HN-5-13]
MASVVNPTTWRSVREAALPQISSESEGAVFSVLGTRALLLYRVDESECRRRQVVGAERLRSIPALECLLGLPVGLPVPVGSLPDQAEVRGLPGGAVEWGADLVTRRAVRPLAVDLAVVRAAGWRTGLERAGRFAPFCRRAVLLDEVLHARSDEILAEAAFYGIGVLVNEPDGIRIALEPEAYRPQRHTAAAWHFVEELYGRLV